MKTFLKIFATGFGAGYLPGAPGTFGTLVAIPVFCLLYRLSGTVYFGVLVGLTFFAVWAANETLELFAVVRKSHDPKQIVLDEIVGFLWTAGFSFHLSGLSPKVWYLWALPFALFRFFDIVKVWPANWVEKNLRDGWGIVMDDVVAGLYAGMICLPLYFFHAKGGL